MTARPSPTTVAIVGPTASGKTGLAIEVAERIGGEVISMDSRQIYRGMDIGTAKPSAAERARVPHHGLDLVDPDVRFNAARFAGYARATISEIESRGKLPLLVGGTGFFLRALTHPIFREPALDSDRRQHLEARLSTFPDAELRRWLHTLDPPIAERLEKGGGRQRLLRALELPLLTGQPLSWWQKNAPPEHEPLIPLVFVIDLPAAALNERIDARVLQMVRDGLVEEVALLLQRGFDESAPGMNATGYRELVPHIRGEISLEDALTKIQRNTRAYARRQRTWFRTQLPPGAIHLDGAAPLADLADRICQAAC